VGSGFWVDVVPVQWSRAGSDLLKSFIARKSVAMAAGKAETAPDSSRRTEATGWRRSLIALASPSQSPLPSWPVSNGQRLLMPVKCGPVGGAEKGKIGGKDLEKVLQEVLNREKEGSELLKSQALSSCITFWSLL